MVDIFFQKWDEKARMWCRDLEQQGHRCHGLTGTPIIAPVVLWRRRPDVYVFRYLNDYPSLIRTLLRAFSEMLTVHLCRWRGIRMLWVLHNVDRESTEHWPRITRYRRSMIASACAHGFVTDPLLVGDARNRFPSVKWGSLTFGTDVDVTTSAEANERIVAAIARVRAALGHGQRKPVYVGLAVTSMADKYLHLARYSELVVNDPDWPFRIGLVFVGNFSGADARWREVAKEIEKHEAIEVVDIVARLDETELRGAFDFVYRSLADLSVPLSVYRAAAAGKPLFTHDAGFVAKLVREFGIGVVWDEVEIAEVNEFFTNWKAARWARFLADRSWTSGAKLAYVES